MRIVMVLIFSSLLYYTLVGSIVGATTAVWVSTFLGSINEVMP